MASRPLSSGNPTGFNLYQDNQTFCGWNTLYPFILLSKPEFVFQPRRFLKNGVEIDEIGAIDAASKSVKYQTSKNVETVAFSQPIQPVSGDEFENAGKNVLAGGVKRKDSYVIVDYDRSGSSARDFMPSACEPILGRVKSYDEDTGRLTITTLLRNWIPARDEVVIAKLFDVTGFTQTNAKKNPAWQQNIELAIQTFFPSLETKLKGKQWTFPDARKKDIFFGGMTFREIFNRSNHDSSEIAIEEFFEKHPYFYSLSVPYPTETRDRVIAQYMALRSGLFNNASIQPALLVLKKVVEDFDVFFETTVPSPPPPGETEDERRAREDAERVREAAERARRERQRQAEEAERLKREQDEALEAARVKREREE